MLSTTNRVNINGLCIDKSSARTTSLLFVIHAAPLSSRRLHEDPGDRQTCPQQSCGGFFIFYFKKPGCGVVFLGYVSNFCFEVQSAVWADEQSALSRRCFHCMNKGLDGVVGSAQSVGGEQAGCLQ